MSLIPSRLSAKPFQSLLIIRFLFAIALIGLAIPSIAYAQHERYELGLRLRKFEKAWDQCQDDTGKKRALAIVVEATNQFFALKFGEAGKTLDAARWALTNDKPRNADQIWVESLMMKPEKRMFDANEKSLKVIVAHSYKVPGAAPANAKATLRIGVGPIVNVDLSKLPVTVDVPFPPPGVDTLNLNASLGDDRNCYSTISIARILDLKDRLATLKKMGLRATIDPSVAVTLNDRLELFQDMIDGTAPETDFPFDLMLKDAERIAEANQFDQLKPGEYWLTIQHDKKRQSHLRVMVPKKIDDKKPVPVVVALHGAGGSENMFFDTYGDGRVVKECEKRGWICVATRSPSFIQGPAVKEIITKLQLSLPIDTKNIFILGHSMGAGQTIDIVQKEKGYFAGAAVMGGSGRVRDANAFESLPVFIGVGDKDFALGGAKSLNQALIKANAKKLTYKEYPNLEHLVIVREALPDVFALFDKSINK